jgi:KUP system potassium uptake protein
LHGGYWSILIAIIPLTIIIVYVTGNKRLYRGFQPMGLDKFLGIYRKKYQQANIQGTALFFAKDVHRIPPYIVRTMFTNGILYSDNIIVSITQKDEPYGVNYFFADTLAPGLRVFEIHFGYMELISIEEILKDAGVNEIVIFYGTEDIDTKNIIWKTYSLIKKVSPDIVHFYKIPSDKLCGVITRVAM